MSEDRLQRALRGLPPQEAAPNFTARVLARLPAGPRPRPWTGLPLWSGLAAAAAALLLVAVVWLPGLHREARRDTPRRSSSPADSVAQGQGATPGSAGVPVPPELDAHARLAALRAEHRELRDEIEALRRQADLPDPVIYVAGNDQMDVILDLRRVPPEALRLDLAPAAYRPNPEARGE